MIKYLVLKDKVRRRKVNMFEFERLRLKSLIYNRNLSLDVRSFFVYKLNCLLKDSSKIRIRNRCIITNRGQSVYRFFRLSRICIKEYASFNQISSIRKSSW
jgi:small subunit ribosomal protein S14